MTAPWLRLLVKLLFPVGISLAGCWLLLRGELPLLGRHVHGWRAGLVGFLLLAATPLTIALGPELGRALGSRPDPDAAARLEEQHSNRLKELHDERQAREAVQCRVEKTYKEKISLEDSVDTPSTKQRKEERDREREREFAELRELIQKAQEEALEDERQGTEEADRKLAVELEGLEHQERRSLLFEGTLVSLSCLLLAGAAVRILGRPIPRHW